MDKVSKKVLNYVVKQYKLKHQPVYVHSIEKNLDLPLGESTIACAHLVTTGYLIYDDTAHSVKIPHSFVNPSQKALHPASFGFEETKAYIADKWIDFLALTIAVVAFIQSCIALYS